MIKDRFLRRILISFLIIVCCIGIHVLPVSGDDNTESILTDQMKNLISQISELAGEAVGEAGTDNDSDQNTGYAQPTEQTDNDSMETTLPTSVLTLIKLDATYVMNETEAEELEASMGQYTPAQDSLVINNAPVFYYYEQLEPIEKEMYDIMLNIARDPVKENIGVMITDMDPTSNDFFISYVRAYYAMTYDHPELFWLYNCIENDICPSSTVNMINGIYIVYFKLDETYTNYETRMTQFNDAAAEFLADINTNASDYEIIRQVHDKLISQVAYNYPVMERGDYENFAHTAYGALVQDSDGNPHAPVCDGYSLAFEYLLQQCGIEAVFVGGDAGNNILDLGGHAWNLVKLDGTWYEVDSTWDDQWNDQIDDPDPRVREMLNDYAFHERLEHFLFLISTEHMTEYNADVDYFTYYFNDGYVIQYSPDCIHLRLTNSNTIVDLFSPEGCSSYALNSVIDSAPVALYDYIT